MRHHEMSTHKRHPHNTQPTANGGVFLCATATSALVTLSLQGMMRGGRCAKDAMGRAGCRCQGSAAVQRRRRAHKAARARLGASVPHVALDALVAALALLVRDFAAPAFARPGTGTGPLALHGVWV